jgi:hypothetical protein
MTRAALFVFLGATHLACGMSVDLGGTAVDAGHEASVVSKDSGTCPSFARPDASAPCGACTKGSKGCQPNGCFNGYFCDVGESDCKSPGTGCSSTVKADAH